MKTHSTTLTALLVTLAMAFGLACAGSGYDDDEMAEKPAAAEAQPAKWNQERVTKIGVEFATAAHELRDVIRNNLVSNVGSGQASAHHRLLNTLRRMQDEATHLAAELKAGGGREETYPSYRHLDLLSRDAAEEARKLFLDAEMLAKITNAGQLLRRLAPYYVGTEG